MRKYLLLLLVPVLLLSCTVFSYKFSAEVDAKIVGRTHNCMGLVYDLFGVEIMQDVCNLSVATMGHFKNAKTIPLTVNVRGVNSEMTGKNIYIELYYKDTQFASENYTPKTITPETFYGFDEKIPNFKWYAYNNIEYNDGISPQELIEKLKEDGKDVEVEKETVKKEPEKEDLKL